MVFKNYSKANCALNLKKLNNLLDNKLSKGSCFQVKIKMSLSTKNFFYNPFYNYEQKKYQDSEQNFFIKE